MYLKKLLLSNYRNYNKLELNFNSNLIVFIGKNAQGKTNILESIYLSCTGRSHRTPKDRELIKWNEEKSLIRTRIDKTYGTSTVDIYLNIKDKKQIVINGMQAKRLGELMGHLNGVIFSPEDLKLIKEGPGERRRFIDMELSQIKPRYFYSLQQYNRILCQRNNLLKKIYKNPSLKKTLPVWNEQMAEIGAYITVQRSIFCEKLLVIAKDMHNRISCNKEELDLYYKSSVPFKNMEIGEIKENFLKMLEERETDDIDKGSTGKGCHRDDINISINNIDVRVFGSQGQQRTAALSLKLSELELMYEETGEYPVLLLDDVMSELDSYRQQMLLDNLGKVQTFITSTDMNNSLLKGADNYEVYSVSEGKILEIEGK